MITNFPHTLSGLLQTSAYPHPVSAIELVETHMSWVLLTGEFAYKLKRPVKYAFVDLSCAERREFACREELRLNRRFAPLLYLEVCAITAPEGVARIGGGGAPIEYAVKMRQFRREQELDRLLASGGVTPGELGSFGSELAAVHAQLPVAGGADPWATPEKVRELVLGNLAECAQGSGMFNAAAEVEALRGPLQQRLDSLMECMAARRVSGRVRECHGDLHAGNIVRQHSGLLAFDCMEFEPAFRWIDVADEIAFLLSDLGVRGCLDHAYGFLAGYLAVSADYQACRLLPMYQAHRALVRAKVCALSTRGASGADLAILRQEWRRRIGFAAAVLSPRRPRLLLMCGPSGSGKSWLARELSPRLRAIHLSSDVVRKRHAGLVQAAGAGATVGEGLYTAAATAEVYADLLRNTDDLLAGGFDVIVDATFGRREHRERFAERALSLGARCQLLACQAPLELLRARVIARARTGTDPSEADLRVLDWQLAHHDALDVDERTRAIQADTSDPNVLAGVIRQLEHS